MKDQFRWGSIELRCSRKPLRGIHYDLRDADFAPAERDALSEWSELRLPPALRPPNRAERRAQLRRRPRP